MFFLQIRVFFFQFSSRNPISTNNIALLALFSLSLSLTLHFENMTPSTYITTLSIQISKWCTLFQHWKLILKSIAAIQSVQRQNKICILDIDVQGVQTIKKLESNNSNSSNKLNPIYVFIAPPSIQALESRLRNRGTETEEAMQRRLNNATKEMEYGMEGVLVMKENNGSTTRASRSSTHFDAVFVNDDLDKTLEDMVMRFREWFPTLLLLDNDDDGATKDGEEDGGSENGKEETKQHQQQQSSSSSFKEGNELIPPPVTDPLSFPQTTQGLQDFLSQIDKDCPLEGYIQTELTYQASRVHIGAGKKLDIPLPPIEQDGSKIEWSITLMDEHEEHLDINFGLVVIVDGEEEEVYAREMGRILSPAPYLMKDNGGSSTASKDGDGGSTGGGGGGEDDDATTSTANTVGSMMEQSHTSAKGKFTVQMAPVKVVIKLDNTYSWFTPKKISYSVTVIPPVDENMRQRSLRAKSVLTTILEGKEAVLAKKEKEKARADALTRIKQEMEGKLNELNSKLKSGKESIQAIQKKSEQAEAEAKTKAKEIKRSLSLVKKEEMTIDEVSSAIIALEEECARLKEKWEELNIEKHVREEEKRKFETEAEERQKERMRLQEEIAAAKEKEKGMVAEVESLARDQLLVRQNLEDLEKERKAREVEEGKYAEEVKFLQKQVDAVKLRFIEPKSLWIL